MNKLLFIDTETTNMAKWKEPSSSESQPDTLQIGMVLVEESPEYEKGYRSMFSLGVMLNHNMPLEINKYAFEAHKITQKMTEDYGLSPDDVTTLILWAMKKSDVIVCHNTQFDLKILRTLGHRYCPDLVKLILDMPSFCTMKKTTGLCGLRNKRNAPKWPTLAELYYFLFHEEFEDAHDALADIQATVKCYYALPEEYRWYPEEG